MHLRAPNIKMQDLSEFRPSFCSSGNSCDEQCNSISMATIEVSLKFLVKVSNGNLGISDAEQHPSTTDCSPKHNSTRHRRKQVRRLASRIASSFNGRPGFHPNPAHFRG